MCVHLFAPGQKIQIDYAAEAVSLVGGRKEAILDVLVTNHSDEAIERLHLVYPYPIATSDGSSADAENVYLEDVTDTWLGDNRYNRFYQTAETSLTRKSTDGSTEVIVEIPNPADIVERLSYKGSISGVQELVPFEVANGEPLTRKQWDILSELGWSVFTIKFKHPIKKDEARWLRMEGRTAVLPENRYTRVEQILRRYAGILVHRFEIAGPKDMRHRLIAALRGAGTVAAKSEPERKARMELHGLQAKLLTRGLLADGTQTTVRDWRLNVFERFYRRTGEPTFYGDIRPAGPLLNFVIGPSGDMQQCYQWKAGEQNTGPEKNNGLFVVRLTAHDIPIVTIVLPWIAFAIGLTSLIIGVTNLILRLRP